MDATLHLQLPEVLSQVLPQKELPRGNKTRESHGDCPSACDGCRHQPAIEEEEADLVVVVVADLQRSSL